MPKPVRKLVFRQPKQASQSSLKTIPKGGSFVDSHLQRMPNSNIIRPSTHPATITPIEVSSTLIIEVTYATSECPRRILAFRKPVDIASVRPVSVCIHVD